MIIDSHVEKETQSMKKRKTVKPEGFDLIEPDIGEDTVQCFRQKKADENAPSLILQVRSVLLCS